jgi:para-aminobenzoate synthetase/4-amino-4-deoxychorismate lyase
MTGSHDNSVVLHDAPEKRWLLFRRPLRIHVARTPSAVASALRAVEHEVADNRLHAAGFIAYEAAPAFDPALVVRSPGDFPLLWFGIYPEAEPLSFPPPTGEIGATLPWQTCVSPDEYDAAFRRIKGHIAAGDTYQVNYSFRMRAPFREDPWHLFVPMIHAQGCDYGAYVHCERWTVCSASPELFLRLDDTTLTSRPMKGTVARGLQHTEDLEKARWLQRSAKNRAENIMIVDMVRNDLGRIAEIGSVGVTTLYEVEKYPTLWQMTSTVRCTTRASTADILRAMFPAASITGAPKARTMRIIAELETTPRRIYTGAIGFLSPQRTAQFSVAIRTVLVDRLSGTAEYGVGGGIVWDSEDKTELEECYTKARILGRPSPDFALLETLRWSPTDGYFLLDDHLARLDASAAFFSRSIDIRAIREQLAALARDLPPQPHRIRLLVPQRGAPMLEAKILSPERCPFRVRLAPRPVNALDQFLYHKTTHRHLYDQALADAPDCDDVLLWNERGEVTESCIANLVVQMDGELLTPPVRCGLLPGTYRADLLRKGTLREAVIRTEDLRRCARIFLVNSVRGMWEVSLVGDGVGTDDCHLPGPEEMERQASPGRVP